ncbi:MAG TPA: TIGR04283 family arsenosugar biosynthesis glycosyltransferase [Stellaceae bacterium]|nr:TIGR04283 family arsenosugar biosynthesis glycosyltransferase [Stellaceae bacterium]
MIPTLDAAAVLPATLAALADATIVDEIVVADGGSRDATVALADSAGARVIAAPRGRGVQLAAGGAAASGQWLVFLHADCVPGPGWEAALAGFIARPGAVDRAGYFALRLDDASPAARRLERLVAWRCRALALPYGDQGLLIHRALYERIGGYAALPLMEDVDLVRRLGRRRLAPLDATVIASARRYRSGGYVRRPLRNLCCLALYFFGLPTPLIARLYG